MNKCISQEIDNRVAEKRAKNKIPKTGETESQSKSILSLLVDDLLHEEAGNTDSRGYIKQSIKIGMCSQVRGFLLGGHDSSSGALKYCYYLLWKHQNTLDRMIAEHNAVFGNDPAHALAQIQADPLKLNHLPYTTAFIKETLRLFPPAGGMQMGRAGAYIVDRTGRRFPTENCGIWTISQGIHYNERYWEEADVFLPERWLAGPDDPLYTGGDRAKGAWLPFEQGPRNCIGQTMVMLELKIALVLTVREVDVIPAYEEWDALHAKGREARGGDQVINTVDGNRAYQAEKVAAHPADGFPVILKLRKC